MPKFPNKTENGLAGSPIRVCRIRAKDLAVWVRLRRALWPGSAAQHREDARRLARQRGFFGVLAWQGDQPVGFAEALIRPFANGCDSQPVPFLEGLWVDPTHRRQEIGRQLVAAVERWAWARGFRELGSDAFLNARISHRAHRAYGFRETERVVYFRKVLQRPPPIR